MSTLLVTIVGGVVVLIIGLLIEYGLIKRKKHIAAESSIPPASTAAVLSNTEPTSKQADPRELSWPEAINRALDSFQTLHDGKDIEVHSTNVDTYSAKLFIVVHGPRPAFHKYYSVIVNKAGDIVTIKQTN
ncbi:MAG TPA: hypothetical protein VGO56_19370 [Pyrinomonadaceae bacterium]|nr:hypothetical protein [Pyrinomonadaceae bacterium]